MKNEGLHFSYLEVENFKSIEKRIVDIGGRSLLITGKNGKGKSSIIQALLSGIDAKSQATDPVKSGEIKAMTKVKIAGKLNGKEEEYTIEMFYTPKNKKGRIVLTNANGDAVPSPKEMLKSIIGNVSFDIFKFLNDSKPKQIDVLKELSGVRVEIDKLDMERKKLFDDRTFLNRKVEADEAVMNNHGLTPDEIDLYSEEKLVEPIKEEMNTISKKITDWNMVKSKTAEYKDEIDTEYPELFKRIANDIDSKLSKIEELKKEILDLEAESDTGKDTLESAEANYTKGQLWLGTHPEPNAKEISDRLSAALLHNQNCEKVTSLAEKQKTLRAEKEKLNKFTVDIDKIDANKDKLMKDSKLPVKGLTFTEDNIFLNGLPLEEGQINTAQLIDVGVEISMALNPNLRTIFLHEGSLFDHEALNALVKKVEERGYQLIAEIVSDSNDLEIVFTEEEV